MATESFYKEFVLDNQKAVDDFYKEYENPTKPKISFDNNISSYEKEKRGEEKLKQILSR